MGGGAAALQQTNYGEIYIPLYDGQSFHATNPITILTESNTQVLLERVLLVTKEDEDVTEGRDGGGSISISHHQPADCIWQKRNRNPDSEISTLGLPKLLRPCAYVLLLY